MPVRGSPSAHWREGRWAVVFASVIASDHLERGNPVCLGFSGLLRHFIPRNDKGVRIASAQPLLAMVQSAICWA